ncbi:MAG: response regulator [Deltaproteobacteria bacterium]|nr:response regulator [Deltaproteobacteria bacterium]
MPTEKILTVDDEADILNLLSYNLKKTGYFVSQAEDGPEAIEIAKKERPDLILLDIMLPNMEGTEVLRRLKADPDTSNIPVIMLTAKGEEIDRIVGLELGAEDYITKPFSPRELLLRVKAILKRKSNSSDSATSENTSTELTYQELTIDEGRHQVLLKRKELKLTITEFRLLKELLRTRGRVQTRDHLLDVAWGEECYVTPRTVDTHVQRLRTKLKGYGKYIETVRGIGYRFNEG